MHVRTSIAAGLLKSSPSSLPKVVRAAFRVGSGFRRESLSCFNAPASTRAALASLPTDLASWMAATSSADRTDREEQVCVGGRDVLCTNITTTDYMYAICVYATMCAYYIYM